MAFRGEHADPGALALEERVGGHRGAVHDEIGGGEESPGVRAQLAREEPDAVHHADGGILGRGRGLGDGHSPFAIHGHEIREGAADIHRDPKRSQRSGRNP